MKLQYAVIISERKILDDELLQIKQKRSRAEYCWTCTPIIIEYVLNQYGISDCTYIDADMIFYNDPSILLDEFYQSHCSVGVIEHRFPTNIAKAKRERYYGKYCVEFNTFKNDILGKDVLTHWKKQCIHQCTMEFGTGSFGDQKYVEEWENTFSGIYVYQNHGAGVAPWNISDYRLISYEQKINLLYQKRERICMIFYHFQSLMILENNTVFIGVYNELGLKETKLIRLLYGEYISQLFDIREKLREVGFTIPHQVLREGERNAVSHMHIKEFLVFLYQCIPGFIDGKKNRVIWNERNGEIDW